MRGQRELEEKPETNQQFRQKREFASSAQVACNQ